MIKSENSNGILYVVSTPIGNLEDITFRAIRTLKECDYILCEDKRVTSILLKKYDINSNLITFHKFNEIKIEEEVLRLLRSGKNISLISDAGTPLISDPGSNLVCKAHELGIQVIPIPGPCSVVTALSIFGIEKKEFLFYGFLPEKKSQRKLTIKNFQTKSDFILLFIAPHDFEKYILEISDIYNECNIYIARELTKIHEEFWCGSIKDLILKLNKKEIVLKGEFVIGLKLFPLKQEFDLNEIIPEMKKYIKAGHSLKEASKHFSNIYNVSAKELYKEYLK